MSQATANTIEECPACEAATVDTGIEEFDGVCDACGIVIHDESDTSPPDWIISDQSSEENDSEEWLEFCRIQNATEKQLAQAFNTLEKIADQIEVAGSVRQKAAEVYCDAFIAEITNGRDTGDFVAACLRVASIQVSKPIPQRRLTNLTTVDAKKFRLALSALTDECDIQPNPQTPTDYLSFISPRLELTDAQREQTESLLAKTEQNQEFSGKNPAGLAAAASYLITSSWTQSDVADVVGVSSETIRVHLNHLREVAHDD